MGFNSIVSNFEASSSPSAAPHYVETNKLNIIADEIGSCCFGLFLLLLLALFSLRILSLSCDTIHTHTHIAHTHTENAHIEYDFVIIIGSDKKQKIITHSRHSNTHIQYIMYIVRQCPQQLDANDFISMLWIVIVEIYAFGQAIDCFCVRLWCLFVYSGSLAQMSI